MEQSKEELYNLLKKEVKKANARISRIEKAFGEDSWGAKKIRPYLETEKLNAITEKGFITVRKSMTESQMKMVEKYVKRFNSYEISTIKGIKDVRQRTIESLRKYYSKPKLDISFSEAETLYELQNSNDYDWIFNYMTPSEFWNFVEEAVNENWTEEEFVNELMIHYIQEGNDEQMIAKCQALYNHIVKEIKMNR